MRGVRALIEERYDTIDFEQNWHVRLLEALRAAYPDRAFNDDYVRDTALIIRARRRGVSRGRGGKYAT